MPSHATQQASPLSGPSPAHDSYTLDALTLYNWGGFEGLHMASIDVGNTAIIGATGSGKTTVVDALMTLLCERPGYNLASTGGHESDRDLVSYVRGVSGQGTDGSSAHIARQSKTVTGITARIVKSEAEQVVIGALFWFDGSSSSASDMQRRWFFSQGPSQSLQLWLEEWRSGGARALSKLARETEGLQLWTSKTAYLAKLQNHFEVGPNAFTLLNRAAGLKQLNSIDGIFRELVLDDHAAFSDALEVANGFDDLALIHAELELAQSQYLALLPLRELARRYQTQSERISAQLLRVKQLPLWFAIQGQTLWAERIAELDTQWQVQHERVEALQHALDTARKQAQVLLQLYLLAGGGSIEQLQESMRDKQLLLAGRKRQLADYQQLASNLALSMPAAMTAQALQQHQQQAQQALATLDAQQQAHRAVMEQAIQLAGNAQQALAQLQAEQEAIRLRPGSNIPPHDQQFRADLAAHLALAPEDLPFVAELVEVQKVQQHWRGAIERALGSQRLRIMVPAQAMRAALQWVNQRHNRVHVRLLEVPEPRPNEAAVEFWADGFCRKLNFKAHACAPAVQRLLAELDRHCVDSAEALQYTPHAMTQQGLMSGRARHFDKQDQKRLSDDWMTGFDNRDRLHSLAQRIEAAQAQWQAQREDKLAAERQQASLAAASTLWQRLQQLQFDDLDTSILQAQLDSLQTQLAVLQDPQSHAGKTKQQWVVAEQQVRAIDGALKASLAEKSKMEERLAQAEKRRSSYCARETQSMDTLGAEALDEVFFSQYLPLSCDTLDESERQAIQTQRSALHDEQGKLHRLDNSIVSQMGKARKEDRGALQEETSEVSAIPAYLERLRVLEEEALPDKKQRFQDYLNQSSEQGVNRLLSAIQSQVTEIRDRLHDLNQTMAKVDFQAGRYLQLHAQEVNLPVLKDINAQLAELRSARLRDDGGQSLYQVVPGIVELLREHATSRNTKAAQALLDARYRLQFSVHVHDRESDEILERRTGSQGGSGGEKEIIASYVLTASLSYALCPQGRARPLFGTIVLDEAFSKSSQAVAGRIIQALREFGLHALFVTPNKELRLLRNHTRSAVLVHRLGSQATLTSIAWQQLDAHYSQKLQQRYTQAVAATSEASGSA